MNLEKQLERQEKIVAGLKIAYERMLEFKRQKNSEVVVMRKGKIVRLKPWLLVPGGAADQIFDDSF